MPSFELNKLQAVKPPASTRALAETGRSAAGAGKAASPAAPGAASGGKGVSIEVNAALNTAKPPVDTDRVSMIRDALREGSYPLVPAEIADAMIAAQISFGIDK